MSMDPDEDTLALQPRPNRVAQRCRPLRPAMARRRCDSHLAGRASKSAIGSHATTFDPVSHDIDFASDASMKICGVGGYPSYSEDMALGLSSRFFSSLAAAISSFALLTFGLSGTAMSQTQTPSGSTSLPSITIQAPKQVTRPQKPEHRAVARNTVRNTVSPRTSPTTPFTAAQESVLAKLARLERASGSCVGGCATSFRSGNRPWVGCSASGWPAYSGTCRNAGNYKTYVECTETAQFLGWRPMEYHWYCTSLAFKK
jgi:hypothetical protein